MERKIGEIFDYQGKSLQVTKGNDGRCEDCFFDQICSRDTYDITGLCDEDLRDDGISVYFKEMNEIMTREEMKDLLPIMQAFADGKTIEYSSDGDLWIETDTPTWCSDKFYRIKKEPQYRPFKTKEECWNEMLKHQPFGWVKEKGDRPSYELLACVSENDEAPISFAVYGSVGMGIIDRPSIKFNEMFNAFTFADSAPFGVKEEV